MILICRSNSLKRVFIIDINTYTYFVIWFATRHLQVLFACIITRLQSFCHRLRPTINYPTAWLERQFQRTGDVIVFHALPTPPGILGPITWTVFSVISLHGLDWLRDFIDNQDIQFTSETERDGHLSFLDILMQRARAHCDQNNLRNERSVVGWGTMLQAGR
jgi:hypothetical protein